MASLSTNALLQKAPALFARLRTLWSLVTIRRRARSLRIAETVSLGDKRFVAVLEFERQRFLIGVTSQSVSLLQGLGAPQLPATLNSSGAGPDARREESGEPS
jgi:flagellar biogenesis protein FliO